MHQSIDWLTTWLAQIAPNTGAEADPNAPANGGSSYSIWSCFLPAMVGLVLMYMMMMTKPKGGDPRKTQELLANLKKNDRVITAGGIFGIVVQASADSEYVTIRIDESNNTRVKLLKSSIAKVIADESGEKDKEA